jgi:3-isopropylmalate/(R)-2-methylmalate dehydratase small subunit
MEPVTVVTSNACPIDANDVDTDQIIPKQYLKRINRTGFGEFLFYDWAKEPGWDLDPNPILVTGRNFGCGSSREHAPWALEDAGFRAIVAPSFADIFRNNCGKIGVVCAQIDEGLVRRLFDLIEADPSVPVTVDLEAQRVAAPGLGSLEGVDAHFDIDPHTKHCLLHGLDDIALTLTHADDIAAHENSRPIWKPLVPTP